MPPKLKIKGKKENIFRFFYCAKASKSEKNAGCEGLIKKVSGSMVGNCGDKMDLGGASLNGKPKQVQPKSNFHPTVKPIELMNYLCGLTKISTGGLILDPFAGSGTTGVACINTGQKFILIERDPDYILIIKARLKHARKQRNNMPPKLKEKKKRKFFEEVLLGDCVHVMKILPDDYFDTIITDPSYGLGVSSKKWTYDLPSKETWDECLRVLKPGGTMLCFTGSRTQHRVTCDIEDAGFEIKDCIMFLYGSGFPKALDISKQFDKRAGQEQKTTYVPNNNNAVFGPMKGGGVSCPNQPNTKKAKEWNGWKSHALKPAYEPICVAMKPNYKTYVDNAEKHGVSGLYIDGSRIKYNSEKDKNRSIKKDHSESSYEKGGLGFDPKSGSITPKRGGGDIRGRYPTNVIIDEEVGRIIDKQSGIKKGGKFKSNTDVNRTVGDNYFSGLGTGGRQGPVNYGDGGGASRFFFCAKASKSEKNTGCEDLEKREKAGSYKFREDGSLDGKPTAPRSNFHPTVKPIKLMNYLCTLTKTPTGGIVLDPFAGSGTTGVACINTGRKFVLIEKDLDYMPIIKARLLHARKG